MIAWGAVNFLNLAGLVFDIVGAVMLARAVILNPKEKIAQQVATAWGYNKHLIPVVIAGKLEAVAGLTILVTGFLLQIAATLGWTGNAYVLAGLLLALVIAIATFMTVLPRLTRAHADKVIAFIEEKRANKYLGGKDV